jgi:nucleosome binding factor SPN SPT16 subunit
MMASLSLEQRKKLAAIEETLKTVTDAIVDLRKSYSLLVDAQKQLVDVIKSGEYLRDFRDVVNFVKKVKIQQQPNVLREVEEVTPTTVRKSIERKGLTSPNALILGVLNKTVTPTEMIFALEAIRARQKLRGRVHD